MKLDRRGFIKLAGGAVAGVGLTPLPWKLMDDMAIWSQDWPWVPDVARYAPINYAHTICTLCEGGCGIKVRLVDDKRSIKVEGSETAPINQGNVCPIGAAGPQYQYHPARWLGPAKRSGGRGSGTMERVSWNEALSEVGRRLADLRAKDLSHTVVMLSGRRHTLTRTLSEYFLTAYGSPNFIDFPSLAGTANLAEQIQFGHSGSLGYDLENSRYILSFGCGIIEGWGSPVNSIRAYSRWRDGQRARLVQIDHRAGLTASKADKWIAAAPGSETALALGLAQIMIAENLYDQAFIDRHTYGFDEFRAMLAKDYAPARVAELTGVPQETLVGLAREFGRAENAVAIAGRGRGALPTPVYELMAVQTLNALKGNINQRGGVIIRKDLPLTSWPSPELDDEAKRGLAEPRLDSSTGGRITETGILPKDLIAAVNAQQGHPINALIIDRANPAFFGADPAAFRQALDKIPFVVSLSGLADETSLRADIVLPECGNFEGPCDVVNPPAVPYPLFGLAGPVLKQELFDTRSAGDIYLDLARAIGGTVGRAMPFANHLDMLLKSAAGLYHSGRGQVAEASGAAPGSEFGQTSRPRLHAGEKEFLQALVAGNFWYDPAFSYGDMGGAFGTPSGKFEFFSQALDKAMADIIGKVGNETAGRGLGVADLSLLPLPHQETFIPAESSRQFPLLMMPLERFRLNNSNLGNAPYLTKLLEDTILKGDNLMVEINPRTASALGLHEGGRAKLATSRGAVTVLVHLFEGARPGVVFVPVGLGHTGFGYYLKGKGVNPAEIAEITTDPLSGQELWWGSRANLSRI